MQNKNIGADSYPFSGHTEKGWNTNDNPESDEMDSSYMKNSASQSTGHSSDIFTYCDSDSISTNSFHNLVSVTDPSTVSTSACTGTLEKSGIFSSSSPFIESEHSDEPPHRNQINGQLLPETVPPSELSNKPDNMVTSLSSIQRPSKRRNSLPSDYPNYKRRLSIDYEVQSLCGLENSDSNSSCDTNRHYGNEESSWTNCYAPYRKRPTSVISSERGSESLVDKLFSEGQRKRYEAMKKRPTKGMDSKRKKDKHVAFGSVYKSFVEGITHSSQNLSELTETDISVQKDGKINKTDIKMLESFNDEGTIHSVSKDMGSEDSHQVVFTANSIPEETDADLKSEFGNLSVDAVSFQQNTVPLDIDDSHTSDKVLAEISSSDSCSLHNVCTDVDDNPEDSHKIADSMPEETDTYLTSKSDNLSVNVISNQQDEIPMDCDIIDDGHASENVLVLKSSIDCAINEVSADTNDDSKDTQQLIFITDTMHEKIDDEIKSQPDCHSIEDGAILVSCDADRFTSENDVSSAKIAADTDDNSVDAILVADSIPKEADTNIISKSDPHSAYVDLHEENAFTDGFTSENDVSSTKISADTDDNSADAILVADSIPKEADTNIISKSDPLSAHVDLHEENVLTDFHSNAHTSEHVLVTEASVMESANIDHNLKESQSAGFITGSLNDETNVVSKSDHLTDFTDSNQQIVMSTNSVTNEITSEDILVPVSSDPVSVNAADNSEDSQQVIFITDSIPKETDTEIMLESDCLASDSNPNEHHILTIDGDASEDMLVYIACEDGEYRLCKISANPDLNSQDSHQLTFITDSLPNECGSGLIDGSNCYIINSDSTQQDVVSVSYPTDCEGPASEVLFKTVPFEENQQNIDLETKTNGPQFYNPGVDKRDTSNSAGNLTTDEISDSLDKIFTQTTESDVLYSIPEEQREVPFDFEGEKLISLGTNISQEASENTYSIIPEASEENMMHDQLANSCSETRPNSENKANLSSVGYNLENKHTVPINQEDTMLVEKNESISDRNQPNESKRSINAPIDLCSENAEEVFKIQATHLDNTEVKICFEKEKTFDNPDGGSESMEVSYENLLEQKKTEVCDMDIVMCESDKNNVIGKFSSYFNSTKEISHNILDETSDSSSKRYHMDELTLVNTTESSNILFHKETKSAVFSNEPQSEYIENSKTENSNFKYQNNILSMESCVESQNSSYKRQTSKARKSASKSSLLKPSENGVLKVIENTINNEVFNLIESKENLSSHDSSFLVQEQVPQNLPTLSDSEAENIPLIESDINFNPDSEMKSFQKSNSPFNMHYNGKHKNGTAKKSFSRSSNKSLGEMSNNCARQISSDSESNDVTSESRKTAQHLSDYNCTEINNPTSSCIVVEGFSVLHNKLENAKQRTALKTFKKPFTVAKKSATKNSSFKTVFQSYFGIKTAKKTCSKSSNKKLLSVNLEDYSSSSVEELSADEAKNSTVIWSPVKDLQLKVCSCSAVAVPCLCNGEELQSLCEAEDTIDEKVVPCTKMVSQQYLLTPSSEIKHRAFCDIHTWRLKKHHCCPKCGIFCTQGSFLHCMYDHPVKGKETHFFHPSCFLVPDTGLPPGCPHCCTFSNFKNVHFSLSEKIPEEASPNDHTKELNITEGLEKYTILMKTQNVESETVSRVCTTSVPPTQDLKTMLMAITKEPSLRLRPTGKCLFNPIKVGDLNKVIQLIANGVDPNHKFNQHKNNTPLHIAAFYGYMGIVQILIQYGASIDAVNDDLETPFILAVEKDQMAVVRYLIDAGAQIDVKNENGLTAFHVACKNNSKEMAEFLYYLGKFDINLQDDGGWTPLVWACEHNFGDLVQWLLNHGADPNVRDNEQNTALHWTACSGNNEILEMLLDINCNFSFVNKRGDSALHIAARKDHWTCVKLLLARNASIEFTNKAGETPIMCCDEDSKSLRILNKYALTSTISDCKSFQQYVVYRDISRGSEKYPIQAVNEVDQEEFIMDFRYITRNCYASNVTVISTVDSMQKCYCKDNCSSSDCTCTHISKCWYGMDGCLVSDFDMFDPPTLYECNKICHCPKTCINRVVQKGLRCPLQLFRTSNKGWGVRTLRDLMKGSFVCEYIGEIICDEEVEKRTDDTYLFDLESGAGDVCIDGRFYGNIARFINHSCEPNLVSLQVFIEHQDKNFPRIAFFTSRHIKAFEELCFDYGLEFWVAKSRSVLCTCNSSLCKYSKDSIDDTLQAYIAEKEAEAFSAMELS